MLTPLATLRTDLEARLDPEARTWLRRALADAARAETDTTATGSADPEATPHRLPPWERHFAEAGRRCARTAPPAAEAAPKPRSGNGGAAPAPAAAPDSADAARVLLLHAADAGPATVSRLYEHGTAAERRAVLLALPHLGLATAPEALPLVHDALRANDTRLVAAAVGPYAAAHLDAHAWRHAVLKCLFTGVPLSAVGELRRRARGDGELARMLADYARERTAAGRAVPAELHRALDLANSPREAPTPRPPHAPRQARAQPPRHP